MPERTVVAFRPLGFIPIVHSLLAAVELKHGQEVLDTGDWWFEIAPAFYLNVAAAYAAAITSVTLKPTTPETNPEMKEPVQKIAGIRIVWTDEAHVTIRLCTDRTDLKP